MLRIVEHMPKVARHSLGIRLINQALNLLSIILRAQHRDSTGGRRRALLEAGELTDELKILARLSHDAAALTQRQYIQLATLLVEIGNQIGGWLRESKR